MSGSEKPKVEKSRQALRQSSPLILTTFVNRVGTIGLSLLPILIVQRGLSPATGSFILGGVKSVVIFGTLLSGVFVDRFGARISLLLGFLLIATGFAGLPFQSIPALILVFAAVVQFGDALTRVSNRMLLTATVERRFHKEAFGWLKMVNNLGQIFSFGLGMVATSLGTMPLMLFDGATGLIAFFVGKKIIPPLLPKKNARLEPVGSDLEKLGIRRKVNLHWKKSREFFPKLVPAIACATVITVWNFYYELLLSGMAARLEITHPGQGLRFFSGTMVMNTVLCTIFAVAATKWVKRPSRVFTFGIMLTVIGVVVGVRYTTSLPGVILSMGLATFGEILLGALAQLTLIRLLPEGGAEGFFYSGMVVLSQLGRIAGASLAFPWIASAPRENWFPLHAFWLPVMGLFLVVFRYHREFDRAVAD